MWRRVSITTLTALWLLFGATVALAAGQGQNGTLVMEGQAQVAGSSRQQQLLLQADAGDGSGWHLAVTLVPTPLTRSRDGFGQQPQGGGERERSGESGEGAGNGGGRSGTTQGSGIGLTGQFTLSGPGAISATGQATGTLDRRGTGELRLMDSPGTVALDGTFSIDQSGGLELRLSGLLPGQPAPATPAAPAVAAATTQTEPNNHVFWYLSRAAGLSAYLVLTLNIVLGLMVGSRRFDKWVPRWRSFDLHQFTALLALGFLALHALALLGDHYIGFTVAQLLVPLAATYRPAWVALGVIAFYLLAVITGSFYVRSVIGQRAWRAIHYLSLGAYALTLGHGLLSGTDSGEPWARVLYLSTALLVAFLTVWRVREGGGRRTTRTAARSTAESAS